MWYNEVRSSLQMKRIKPLKKGKGGHNEERDYFEVVLDTPVVTPSLRNGVGFWPTPPNTTFCCGC